MPICQFCGDDKKLCKAHIVPQAFNYPRLPDERSSILASNNKGFRTRRSQTGVYDTNILCSECDQKLGVFDGYAAGELLRATNRTPQKLDGKVVFFEYPDCDPEKIVRFALSVLWRAAVSKQHFYKRVELGPYLAAIKSYLFGSIDLPKSIGVYPTEFVNAEVLNNRIPQLDPHDARHDGVRIWHLYANRFCFYIRTDKKPAKHYELLGLSNRGPVRVLARDLMKSKELDALRRVAREADD